MSVYYNEIDPFAAAWLRELIAADLIAAGDVDERSIVDVKASDVRGYRQAHFFAGIGVWSYALRRAGWADDRRVWTGSCPCQPFSSAGQGAGADDSRHLWPVWFDLVKECRPDVVFGEQVASSDGLGWLDLVHADLEAANYAVGAVDLCAAGLGAPHIRQRIFFVADASSERCDRERLRVLAGESRPSDAEVRRGGEVSAGSSNSRGWLSGAGRSHGRDAGIDSGPRFLADAERQRSEDALHERGDVPAPAPERSPGHAGGAGASFWSACDWLSCRDGKARPVEPGTFPLVTGTPARVGRLRGYGNSINAEVAAAFIEAYLDTLEELRA